MNMKQRKRLTRIKPSVKKIIISNALNSREKPRLQLASELKEIIEHMGENSPTEETMIKMISDARNQGPNPLDAPWHLGFTQREISLESIPYIFAVQSYAGIKEFGSISARQAGWISHFRGFYKMPMSESETFDLFRISGYYATREIVSEIAGFPEFDTTELDSALRQGKLMDMIQADIMSMVKQTGSLYSKATDRRDKALLTESQLKKRYEKAAEILFDGITERMQEKANQYLIEHPNATEDDIVNLLKQGGENENAQK